MPGGDRTGPLGEGQLTGRGLGPCGRGLARGRGMGYRRMGFRAAGFEPELSNQRMNQTGKTMRLYVKASLA